MASKAIVNQFAILKYKRLADKRCIAENQDWWLPRQGRASTMHYKLFACYPPPPPRPLLQSLTAAGYTYLRVSACHCRLQCDTRSRDIAAPYRRLPSACSGGPGSIYTHVNKHYVTVACVYMSAGGAVLTLPYAVVYMTSHGTTVYCV